MSLTMNSKVFAPGSLAAEPWVCAEAIRAATAPPSIAAPDRNSARRPIVLVMVASRILVLSGKAGRPNVIIQHSAKEAGETGGPKVPRNGLATLSRHTVV